jgi:2-polyprenyl-3-methyl-5-hydroxy-6-metoxy-1,4-benzoquinol methylase
MIIEKKLGIKGDYQFKAINSKNPLQRNWHRNKFDILIDYLRKDRDLKNKKILDLGTGSGNFELLFHDKFKKIVGADYNDEALDFLNSKLEERDIKNVELKIADFTKLEESIFEDKFDYIIMIDVIEHFKKIEAEKLLPKLYNLLNEKGQIIIITPNYTSAWVVLEKALDKIQLVPKFDGEQHLAKYDTKNLTELFSKQFSLKEITTFNTLSYILISYHLNKAVSKMESKLKSKFGNLVFAAFQKN